MRLPLLAQPLPSHQLASLTRTLFEGRGFTVAPTRYGQEEVFMLLKGSRQAIARYYWSSGIVDVAAYRGIGPLDHGHRRDPGVLRDQWPFQPAGRRLRGDPAHSIDRRHGVA